MSFTTEQSNKTCHPETVLFSLPSEKSQEQALPPALNLNWGGGILLTSSWCSSLPVVPLEAMLVSEWERIWLFFVPLATGTVWPSEKLDLRRTLPGWLCLPASWSPKEEAAESGFWELLEENKGEPLLPALLL